MTKRAYKQFCPAARSLDTIGERWTLLIVRDLLRGPRRYTDLRAGLPGMASNLLAHRLTEMEQAGLIRREHQAGPSPRQVYVLTDRGRELRPVLLALGRFGLPYLDLPTDEQPLIGELVPEALVTLALPEELPESELSIRFDLEEGHYLMRLGPSGPPGRRASETDRMVVEEITTNTSPDTADVGVSGSLGVLLLVRRGDLRGEEALEQALVAFNGAADDVAAVRRLYGFERTLSPLAPPG